MTLPAGTVTFLFTDVEGSTRLWERHGAAMAAVQERHDALLTAAVRDHGGHVVKTMGDGLMAAFAVADSALAATVDAQAAVIGEPWAVSDPIRVRMGLHTGAADPVDGDYFGGPVNRTARVAEAANGGQILASAATAGLAAPRRDVELRPLGHHRLRDLSEPLALFQVVAPGLPDVQVPLRTLDAVDHNLPAPRTAFVGRAAEVADGTAAVLANRLVTLTGLGGAGKTRLALRVGGEAALAFPDGVRFVELAAAHDHGVADSIAAATGVGDGSGHVEDRLVAHLRGRAVLLVVDNCEHVLAEAACVLDRLLAACPGVSVLATSRAPLGLAGEHVRVVAPLAVDEAPDAVELFVERARAARAGFELTAATRAAVERACRAVDGLPLAIELAGARVAHLSPAEIADRLEVHLGLLASRDPTAPGRHRTLTSALEWSHGLLAEDEARLFRRLSVFARPAPLDAIEVVCGDGPSADVLDVVGTLVDGNLVTTEEADGVTRFGMLGVVRRHAADKLAEAVEADGVHERHARWAAGALAEHGFLGLDDAGRAEVLTALDRMLDAGHGELAATLAGGAWRAWELSGRLAEGRAALERALQAAEASAADPGPVLAGLAQLAFAARDFADAVAYHERNLERARATGADREAAAALNALSMAALYLGDTLRAAEAAQDASARFAALGDQTGLAFAQSSLAMIERAAGRTTEARAHLLDSLRLLRLAGRRREAASVLTNLGNLASDTGDTRGAHRFYEGALQLQQDVGDRRGAALSLNNLSILAGQRGDLDRAVELGDEALEHFRVAGDRPGEAATLNNLANVAREHGDVAGALARYHESAELFRAVGDANGLGTTLANLADLARSCGEARMAWRSLVDAARLNLAVGQPVAAVGALGGLSDLAAAAGLDEMARRLRAPVGDAAAVDVLLDDAAATDIPEVLAATDHAPTAPELTKRERQVAGLVARGLTNRDIADQLFVSERTVDTHITHIRTKLGITSRTQLTRWALERGLA